MLEADPSPRSLQPSKWNRIPEELFSTTIAPLLTPSELSRFSRATRVGYSLSQKPLDKAYNKTTTALETYRVEYKQDVSPQAREKATRIMSHTLLAASYIPFAGLIYQLNSLIRPQLQTCGIREAATFPGLEQCIESVLSTRSRDRDLLHLTLFEGAIDLGVEQGAHIIVGLLTIADDIMVFRQGMDHGLAISSSWLCALNAILVWEAGMNHIGAERNDLSVPITLAKGWIGALISARRTSLIAGIILNQLPTLSVFDLSSVVFAVSATCIHFKTAQKITKTGLEGISLPTRMCKTVNGVKAAGIKVYRDMMRALVRPSTTQLIKTTQ
jgi:hypothetical protein